MKLLLSAAAGMLSMLAFTLSREGYVGVSDQPLSAFSPVWLLYALLLAGLWWLFFKFVRRVSAGQAVLGLCFGAVNYFASALFAYDTWGYLNSFRHWGRAVLQILGQAAVMAAAAALVCFWLEKRAKKEWRWVSTLWARVSDGWAGRAYRRRPVLFVMGVLLLCWAPYLVIFFPGTVVWDMAEMAAMQFGLREMTTWHPVLMTWLFSGCVRFGRVFGSDNIGVFCFTLLQSALLSYALSRALELVRKLNASRAFRMSALFFFAFTPVFASFAQAVGKDTVYAALVLLFTVQTIERLRFGTPKPAAVIGFGLTALLMCLTRHNGVYLLLPTAAVLAFVLRGNVRWLAMAALGAALAVVFMFNGLLVPALGIKDARASGVYSAAFQQSARVLRDREVDAEEYAEIDRVLDAEHLAALYEPIISDPVKYTFKQYGLGRDVETGALARYRGTWLKMLAEYPLTYLEAFVAGSTGYYAFTPKIDAARTYNYQGGIRFVFETVPAGDDPLDLHAAQIPAFAKARELLAMYARGWRRVPVLELFLFCAGYTWLLLIAALSLVRRKRARDLAAFLPALLTLLACLLSPVNDYFRYFLPVVAAFVPLLGLAGTPGNGELGMRNEE
jgi:hypothetical protein